MARTTRPKTAAKAEDEPVILNEPDLDDDDDDERYERGQNPWMRGLWMLLFAFLFQVAQWVLWVATALQFLWILFAKEKNENIAEFGASMSKWLAKAARFQTAASEDRPFPFSRWGE